MGMPVPVIISASGPVRKPTQSTDVVFGVAQLSQGNLIEHRREARWVILLPLPEGFRPDERHDRVDPDAVGTLFDCG